MQQRRQLCRNFLRGSCQYGDRCKFIHAREPQQTPNLFSFGNQVGFQQQRQQEQQQQQINPFGFGVQSKPRPAADLGSKPNQFKPFENKWTRLSSGNATSSHPSDTSSQSSNHQCTDLESCKRIMHEDFEHEMPLWKLTCYGHWRYALCDIKGDISCEELRAAAYDEAGHGMSFQSIVERERNMLSSKMSEFKNVLQSPYAASASSPSDQSGPFGVGMHTMSTAAQIANVPSQPNFVQQPASSNVGFGARQGLQSSPFAAVGTLFGNSNPFSNFGQTARVPERNTSPSANSVLQQVANLSSSHSFGDIGLTTVENQPNLVRSQEYESIDPAIWRKEKWKCGEIPEVAPPDEVIS